MKQDILTDETTKIKLKFPMHFRISSTFWRPYWISACRLTCHGGRQVSVSLQLWHQRTHGLLQSMWNLEAHVMTSWWRNQLQLNLKFSNYITRVSCLPSVGWNYLSIPVEVWEWISNFIPHFITRHVITYPCCRGFKLNHIDNRGP